MGGERTAYTRYGAYSVAHPHKVHFARSARKAGLGNDASSSINGANEPNPPRRKSHRRREKGAVVNKAELIERIAEQADMPKEEAHKHFEAFE